MARVSKMDFAESCGLSLGNLYNYTKRGKVIVDDDDMIDDQVEQNAYFLQKRLERLAKKNPKQKASSKKGKRAKTKKEKFAGMLDVERRKKQEEIFSLDRQKREAEIRKMMRQERLMEMQEGRLSGQLIPTSLVSSEVKQFAQTVMVSFYNTIDAIIVDIAKKGRMSRVDIADLRRKIKEATNYAVDSSVNSTVKALHAIAQEQSQKRHAA